jgi:hypothetical protein
MPMMLASYFICASMAIGFVMALAHLRLTFFTRAFSPRDTALDAGMRTIAPIISPKLTMMQGQTGFHATHSLGIITLSVVYGYLVLVQPAFFFASYFLVGFGAAILAAYAVIAKRYFFDVPFAGISIALALYVIGAVIAYA